LFQSGIRRSHLGIRLRPEVTVAIPVVRPAAAAADPARRAHQVALLPQAHRRHARVERRKNKTLKNKPFKKQILNKTHP